MSDKLKSASVTARLFSRRTMRRGADTALHERNNALGLLAGFAFGLGVDDFAGIDDKAAVLAPSNVGLKVERLRIASARAEASQRTRHGRDKGRLPRPSRAAPWSNPSTRCGPSTMR